MLEPVTAIASIAHRSGGVLFVGVAFMLCAFDLSLSSAAGFGALQSLVVSCRQVVTGHWQR